jgi:putative solute:sodium symporter small subunit
MAGKDLQAYWKENLFYIIIHLAILFVVSFFAGIMICDPLDAMGRVGGFPIGFWFANQASIIVFVILIFTYVYLMDKLDRKYDVHED